MRRAGGGRLEEGAYAGDFVGERIVPILYVGLKLATQYSNTERMGGMIEFE